VQSSLAGVRSGPDEFSDAGGTRFPCTADGHERLLRVVIERGPGAHDRGTEGSPATDAAQRKASFAHGFGDVRTQCRTPRPEAAGSSPRGCPRLCGAVAA